MLALSKPERSEGASKGCGGWICTNDLKVMSLASYCCSTPRLYYNIKPLANQLLNLYYFKQASVVQRLERSTHNAQKMVRLHPEAQMKLRAASCAVSKRNSSEANPPSPPVGGFGRVLLAFISGLTPGVFGEGE